MLSYQFKHTKQTVVLHIDYSLEQNFPSPFMYEGHLQKYSILSKTQVAKSWQLCVPVSQGSGKTQNESATVTFLCFETNFQLAGEGKAELKWKKANWNWRACQNLAANDGKWSQCQSLEARPKNPPWREHRPRNIRKPLFSRQASEGFCLLSQINPDTPSYTKTAQALGRCETVPDDRHWKWTRF